MVAAMWQLNKNVEAFTLEMCGMLYSKYNVHISSYVIDNVILCTPYPYAFYICSHFYTNGISSINLL